MEIIVLTKNELQKLIEESHNKIKELIRVNEKPEPQKELISTKEACKVFDTTRQNLHKKVRDGILICYKFGNRNYYKYEEIKQTILNQ